VFVVDEVSYSEEELNGIKKEIKDISKAILMNSSDVSICLYGLDGTGNTQMSFYGRTDKIENLERLLSNVKKKTLNGKNIVVLSSCIDFLTASHKISEQSANRQEYCFIFYNSGYKDIDGNLVFNYLSKSPKSYNDDYGKKILELIEREGLSIDFSTITNAYAELENLTNSYAYEISDKTNGINVESSINEVVVKKCLEHIYNKVPENVNLYKILIATNFDYVNLDKPIIEKYIENAIKYGHKYIYDDSVFDEDDLVDCADTDCDGLWDFQEIKIFKGMGETSENQIIKFENGKLILPSVNEMTNIVFKDMYSRGEIIEFREHFAKQYGYDVTSKFWQMPVLPIISNPQMKDADGDGLNDNVDNAPFVQTEIPDFFKQLIINNVVDYSEIVRISENCYICTEKILNLADSNFVSNYILETNDISYEDWMIIVSGLAEAENYCDCLASVYVGKDVVYFAAPSDVISDEIVVMAHQAADSHRKAIVSPLLEDDISYQALKAYSDQINQEQYLKNQKFEDSINDKFVLNELFEILGFYDGNEIVGSVVDSGSSTLDSFYKSACRFVHYISFDNIRCALASTNVKYIEYVTWYRHEYPDSTFVEELKSYLSTNIDVASEYVVLDINDRLFEGTAESRGEVFGEALFAIFLDVSIAKALKGNAAGSAESELFDELSDIRFRDDVFDGNYAELKSMRAYKIGNETVTMRLRPANHDEFGKIFKMIDEKHKSEFIKIFKKFDIDADDLVERLSVNSKATTTAINKHFDDFVKYSENLTYGSEFIKVFTTYPQYADDIIYYVNKSGNKFISAFSKNSQNANIFLNILRDNADYADDWILYAGKNDITSVKNVDIRDVITKRNLTELDEIDFINKVIYEDKDASRLYMENPNVPQTEAEWANKQIFEKGRKRFEALSKEDINAYFCEGVQKGEQCNLFVDELKSIKKYVFRISVDKPTLRVEVEKILEQLRDLYPQYDISAVYGYGG